jgi:hypothetical protein
MAVGDQAISSLFLLHSRAVHDAEIYEARA